MKIKILFEEYKNLTTGNEKIFSDSGMVNRFAELKLGFFPLGSGILTNQSEIEIAEIAEGGTMVLGNDFGTVSYVENKCKEKRENNSRTIQNLQKVGLDMEKTFFTNLFIGLRDDVKHTGTTMTKRIIKREQEYIDLSFEFFKRQLEILKPKLVVCLGTEVGKILSENSEAFSDFKLKETSLTELYGDYNEKKYIVNTNDEVFGQRKFILIPHPSYAHINWKINDIEKKIKSALQN